MTKKLEMYKCNVCGNVAEILVTGLGELVCCGEPMERLVPKNDESDALLTEKHTPKIDVYEEGTVIRVTNHPMEKEHYIMLIQGESEDKNNVHIKFFYPGENPEMMLPETNNINEAYSYCNIHGLYKGTKNHDD